MRNPLTHYTLLAKRWAWVILLGIVLCGGSTYIITKLMHPVYQATALLLVSFNTSNSGYDNTTAALEILPTYAQIVTNAAVLQPVLAQHKGLTLQQLSSMISVKPQSNTQIIELDVSSTDPQLAAQLANEVGQSLAGYSNTKLNAAVQVFPAIEPTTPIQPKPSLDALLGALVGFGLALALIVAFEWTDDRITHPEEIQELLGVDILTTIPQLSRNERVKNAEEIPALAEGCRILCANINAAQQIKPFKLLMVTSALAGEGKSTIAANLASFLAMSGKQVLLVDADLRHPVLDQHFQLGKHQGLSNVFLEMWAQVQVELADQPTEIPSLRVLTAGVTPSNPVELLQSRLAEQLFEHFKTLRFDYIIFDTPPLLPLADTRILASYMDAAVLVVDVSKTPRKILVQAMQALRRSPLMLLGVIANKSQWPDYGDIRDYLNSTQQQSAKTNLSLSIPPLPPPEVVSANGTSTREWGKADNSFPTPSKAVLDAVAAKGISQVESSLPPPNTVLSTVTAKGMPNKQHLDRVDTLPLPPGNPHSETVLNEQKTKTDNTPSTTPKSWHSGSISEENEQELKRETHKLPAVKSSRVNGSPGDQSTSASLPQPQKES